MHRKKKEAELLALDLEIERTLTRLRKLKIYEQERMVEQEDMGDNTQEETLNRTIARQRTMEDLWRPVIREDYSTMGALVVDAKNFELKPTLITMVQQNQFTRHPYEDPNVHMGRFLRMANIVKMNGVRSDVIKLQLFLFSLRDTIATWFESLPYGSVNTWEELVEAYMEIFFPPTLTFERREIISFKQGEDESLYNAWERYKKLLKRCPMHGIDQITHMDIFYHAMNYSSKGIIDAVCCGAFKGKSAEEANQIIEELAK